MVVSQVQAASVAKSPTGDGSMSSLHGVAGDYDELVRQATQQSYNVSAGNQFAGMAGWNLALQAQPGGYVGTGASGGRFSTPGVYGGSAFNAEQARLQRIAGMQAEAINPAIVHAAPALGALNVLVTGVGSRNDDGYGEMRAVPWNLRDALNDPSVANTPGGAVLGFGYNVVEGVIGNAAAMFSPNNLNPVSGEMLSPGAMQLAKEDLAITVGSLGIGGGTQAVQQGVRVAGRATVESFGPQIESMLDRTVPGLRMYAAPERAASVAADGTSTVYRVQGGVMPNASKTLITLDAAGNPVIQNGTLNISIGDVSHAQYFQSLRPGSTVTSFEIPSWLDSFIQESAIPQYGYRNNPLNQGGLAPKIVDPTTPGRSYELPSPWAQWLQENAIPNSGKVK